MVLSHSSFTSYMYQDSGTSKPKINWKSPEENWSEQTWETDFDSFQKYNCKFYCWFLPIWSVAPGMLIPPIPRAAFLVVLYKMAWNHGKQGTAAAITWWTAAFSTTFALQIKEGRDKYIMALSVTLNLHSPLGYIQMEMFMNAFIRPLQSCRLLRKCQPGISAHF